MRKSKFIVMRINLIVVACIALLSLIFTACHKKPSLLECQSKIQSMCPAGWHYFEQDESFGLETIDSVRVVYEYQEESVPPPMNYHAFMEKPRITLKLSPDNLEGHSCIAIEDGQFVCLIEDWRFRRDEIINDEGQLIRQEWSILKEEMRQLLNNGQN